MISKLNFSIVSAFLLISQLFFACSEKPTQEEDNNGAILLDLNTIKERGYVTAIMVNNSTSLFLYQGKTMGYEYELIKRYTDKIGIDLKIDVTQSLEEGFRKLKDGEGDILAFNLTVTKERKKKVAFTDHHRLVRSVLIQRKPKNWKKMKLHEIEGEMLRTQVHLIGKDVHVRANSSFVRRLNDLADEIGGDINVIESEDDTERLINMVAEGEIDYTVAEEDVAYVNMRYFPNIDIETPVSFEQQIAWGVRKNAPALLQSLNEWLAETKSSSDYYAIYDKYYKSTRAALRRKKDDYFSQATGVLSAYDSLLYVHSKKLGWDWRLLAALVLRESKFNPSAVSGMGAVGLMQLLPETASFYGVTDLNDPEQNIIAGTNHLKWLMEYWQEKGVKPTQIVKFVLGSYNVGHAHVMDAVKLAEKYGSDPLIWEGSVAEYLVKKEQREFYSDAVVNYGYCRGSEAVDYVHFIRASYANYLELLPEEMTHLN